MTDFTTILPAGPEAPETEPFRFELAGKRFELPALNSKDVPLPLVPVFLALAGGQIESDEDRIRVAGTFIAYLESEHRDLWRHLKAQREALRYVIGLIEQWGEHSRLDPSRPASGA